MPTEKKNDVCERPVKRASDLVESKTICLPRKYWKLLTKEAGNETVTKYTAKVLQNRFAEENETKTAYVYDVEEFLLLSILFGKENEIADYWANNFDVNSTLYTFHPKRNFSNVKVEYTGRMQEALHPQAED